MARWSSLWGSFKDTLSVAPRNGLLWALQFAGNIAIFLGIVAFLRTPDAYWWQLVFQAILALAIVVAALVLHGGTLNYFAGAHQDRATTLPPPFRTALKHIVALAIAAFVIHFLQHLVGHLDAYSTSFPGYLRSGFPAWLRRAISEPALDNTYSFFVDVLTWIVVPGLTLPFALFTASQGFRGFVAFREWWSTIKPPVYWIVLVIAAIIGVYCTGKIMDWKLDPRTATLPAEKTSLFFRLLFAYLLAIFSWLLAASALGRARLSTGQTGSKPA